MADERETVDWDRAPNGAIDERAAVPLPPDRRLDIRRRLDRHGRLVDYAIVLTAATGEELIRADMSHGAPEIHRGRGVARPVGAAIRTFADVLRVYDLGYGMVMDYHEASAQSRLSGDE